MDNKKAKQMIFNIADSEDESIRHPFGHFFMMKVLLLAFLTDGALMIIPMTMS